MTEGKKASKFRFAQNIFHRYFGERKELSVFYSPPHKCYMTTIEFDWRESHFQSMIRKTSVSFFHVEMKRNLMGVVNIFRIFRRFGKFVEKIFKWKLAIKLISTRIFAGFWIFCELSFNLFLHQSWIHLMVFFVALRDIFFIFAMHVYSFARTKY